MSFKLKDSFLFPISLLEILTKGGVCLSHALNEVIAVFTHN